MRNIDRENSGAARLRRISRLGAAFAALAVLLAASPATAALEPVTPFADNAALQASGAALGARTAIGNANDDRIELAQRRGGGGGRRNDERTPERGSSAQLEGGTSADRYGGSSADRRGVAGRYDPRNRGVRQYQASDRKRDRERPKSDELQDQEDDPPQDRYLFAPPDPSQTRDRGDRD